MSESTKSNTVNLPYEDAEVDKTFTQAWAQRWLDLHQHKQTEIDKVRQRLANSLIPVQGPGQAFEVTIDVSDIITLLRNGNESDKDFAEDLLRELLARKMSKVD